MKDTEKIIFLGREYKNTSHCYNENKHLAKISLPTFSKRVKEGLSIEEAFANPKKKTGRSKFGKHIVEGVEYEGLPAIARAYGMSEDAVYKRYSRGYRGGDLVPSKRRKNYCPPNVEPKQRKTEIKIGEKTYRSALQACKTFGINYSTYRRKYYQGWTNEQIFGLEAVEDGRTKKRKIYDLNGHEFSMKELSEKFNISAATIKYRLDRGATIEQAIGLEEIEKGCLSSPVKHVKKRPKIELEVFGKKYNSYKKLADEFSLPVYTVRQRILDYGYTPEEAVTSRGKSKKVIVEGVEYESQAKAAEAYGISLPIFLGRRNNGLTIEQALGIEEYDTKHTICYKGKKYRSRLSLASEKKISISKLTSRINSGLSLEEAIEVGGKILNKGRYNETILLRDPELAASDAELYFIKFVFNGSIYHKVGITTKNVNDRMRGKSFAYEIIITANNNLLNVWKLEQAILDLVKDKKANFSADFLDGYSEVLNVTHEEAIIIKTLIETYSF